MSSRGAPAELALVVDLELPASWPADGMGPPADLIALLPEPSSLPRGGWIAVTEGQAPRSAMSRLFRRPKGAHLSVRCAALLARGYTSVGGGLDANGRELAWGLVAD